MLWQPSTLHPASTSTLLGGLYAGWPICIASMQVDWLFDFFFFFGSAPCVFNVYINEFDIFECYEIQWNQFLYMLSDRSKSYIKMHLLEKEGDLFYETKFKTSVSLNLKRARKSWFYIFIRKQTKMPNSCFAVCCWRVFFEIQVKMPKHHDTHLTIRLLCCCNGETLVCLFAMSSEPEGPCDPVYPDPSKRNECQSIQPCSGVFCSVGDMSYSSVPPKKGHSICRCPSPLMGSTLGTVQVQG